MRKITKIILHCSATKEGLDFKKKNIEQWHKERGFPCSGGTYCGYHYIIDLDGTIEIGKPFGYAGTHCKGENACSIGICYIGGLDKDGQPCDTRTAAQCESMVNLVRVLRACFPEAKVYGHRDFASRDCPCFEVRHFFPTQWCGEK